MGLTMAGFVCKDLKGIAPCWEIAGKLYQICRNKWTPQQEPNLDILRSNRNDVSKKNNKHFPQGAMMWCDISYMLYIIKAFHAFFYVLFSGYMPTFVSSYLLVFTVPPTQTHSVAVHNTYHLQIAPFCLRHCLTSCDCIIHLTIYGQLQISAQSWPVLLILKALILSFWAVVWGYLWESISQI